MPVVNGLVSTAIASVGMSSALLVVVRSGDFLVTSAPEGMPQLTGSCCMDMVDRDAVHSVAGERIKSR